MERGQRLFETCDFNAAAFLIFTKEGEVNNFLLLPLCYAKFLFITRHRYYIYSYFAIHAALLLHACLFYVIVLTPPPPTTRTMLISMSSETWRLLANLLLFHTPNLYQDPRILFYLQLHGLEVQAGELTFKPINQPWSS